MVQIGVETSQNGWNYWISPEPASSDESGGLQ